MPLYTKQVVEPALVLTQNQLVDLCVCGGVGGCLRRERSLEDPLIDLRDLDEVVHGVV